jgi:hypothetical protein
MEKINFAEQKISLAQTILSLKDVGFITQIEAFIKELISTKSEDVVQVQDIYDAKLMAFNEWNKQFEGDIDLDDFIPECGMTLRDFRLKVYNAEKGQGISKQEFENRVNAW